jgi:hypothetical protein
VAQGVAAGVLGRDAFVGGIATALLGLALHFVIAYGWTTVYLLVYRRWAALRRLTRTDRGAIIVGAIVGACIWLAMDFLVIPLSRARPTPVLSGMFLTMLIGHMVVVGQPIALIVRDPEPR